jgi:nucleotide-binding universal stress UspA family protein
MISVAESGEEGVLMARQKQASEPYEIVVPTDFSSGSTRAMAFALARAGRASRVTAVHAVDPVPYRFGTVWVVRAIPREMEFPGERHRARKETQERFETSADRNLRKHTTKISIVFGAPVKAITNFASRTAADAIVMGIRSGGELSRAATHIPWALAHRVIAEAKCPVMTIRG